MRQQSLNERSGLCMAAVAALALVFGAGTAEAGGYKHKYFGHYAKQYKYHNGAGSVLGALGGEDGKRRPPNPASILLANWQSVIESLGPERLIIGGKSMGGRIASMIADETGVRGLACLGYPFHPPGRLEKLRVDHLQALKTPTLILQGTRDPFGSLEEVPGYPLSPAIRLHWLEDGDHGFTPRKLSSRTETQNWNEAISALAGFAATL